MCFILDDLPRQKRKPIQNSEIFTVSRHLVQRKTYLLPYITHICACTQFMSMNEENISNEFNSTFRYPLTLICKTESVRKTWMHE